MTDHEKAEMLLWDFALRSQMDEERAYRNYRGFMDASEGVMVAHQELRYQLDRGRIQ